VTHQQALDSTSLNALLQNGPTQPRRIQSVAVHLDAILQARALGHTWDAIAEALSMQRPTLINSVKTLMHRANSHPAETLIKQSPILPSLNKRKEQFKTSISKTSMLNSAIPIQTSNQSSTETLASGIVALGRATPDKFNI